MSQDASARAKRPYWSGSVLLVLALASGCAGAPRNPRTAPRSAVPNVVSAATIFAEPVPDAEMELEGLQRATSPAAMLRAAFLNLRLGRPQATLDCAAQVIYAPLPPSANEESFARYLRAEAYAAKGTPELGSFDRQRARLLALDAELQRRLLPPPETRPAAESSAALAVAGRQQWHAEAATRSNLEPMGRPSRLTIHHSAMYFRDTRPASCAAQILMIQREHMNNRGYADIGYHYLIDPSGRIWQGRDLRWQGAHASGDNNIRNIGICLLGNFVRGRSGQGPTAAQTASMRQLVGSLMQRYEFGGDAIYCHSDFKATECPGPLLEPVVAQLARDLRRSRSTRVAAVAP